MVWQLGPPPRPLYRAQGTVPGPCECWPPKAHSSSLQTLALAGRSDGHPGEEAQSLRQTPGPRPSHASRPSSVCPSSGASPPPPTPGITARGAPAAPGPASVLRRAATASSGLRFSTKPAETADSPQNAQRRKHFWARTICATEFAESRDGGARAPAPLWRMVCLSLTGAEALWSDR